MFRKMQEKLAKKLCPNVFDDIRYYQENGRKWELKYYSLENEVEKYRKTNDGLKKILDREMKKEKELCKLVFDKDKNPLIMAISNYNTTYKGDEVVMIRIISPISERNHELLVNARINYDSSKIVIEDIQGGYNKGYGTVAMHEILAIAKQKEINTLVGQLCNEDLKDHQDRLAHFYEKFGFSVEITKVKENYMEGKIKLELTN